MTDQSSSALERVAREAGLDETIEQTFPASDPPSTIPNPCEYELLDDGDLHPEPGPASNAGCSSSQIPRPPGLPGLP